MATISDRKIRDIKPGDKDKWLGGGGGLWLRVRASGRKTFIYRTKRQGKTTVETLGEWEPDFLLSDARQEVLKRRRSTKRHSARDHTVRELANEFYSRWIEANYKRPEQIRRYLDKDMTTILDLKLSEVHRADISEVVKQKALASKVSANRLLAIMKAMFRFAIETGWAESSPAEMLTRRTAGGKEKARDRVLTDDEIIKLWSACDGTAHGPLLRFLLLSGQRIGEVRSAKWRDLRDGRWFIDDNKSSRPHFVPLSTAMESVLQGRSKDYELLFEIRTATGVQAWLRRWCERERVAPFTPHDLRRTAATGINRLGFAPHVTEKILNHAMTGVMAVYNHHDYAGERAQALEAWGKFILDLVAKGAPLRSG